jgi:hypothetical protein
MQALLSDVLLIVGEGYNLVFQCVPDQARKLGHGDGAGADVHEEGFSGEDSFWDRLVEWIGYVDEGRKVGKKIGRDDGANAGVSSSIGGNFGLCGGVDVVHDVCI